MNTVKKVIEGANNKTVDVLEFLQCKLNKCIEKNETVCISIGNHELESRSTIKIEECNIDKEHLDICGDHNYELHLDLNEDTEIFYENEYDEQNLHIHKKEVEVDLYFI